ncbi:MAG: TlpA family protein disulfide reductase [Verrucomicrobiales bacterium]|nr:TlpA family protein disulfide reductase [Verrucomicrobiales bacterium]
MNTLRPSRRWILWAITAALAILAASYLRPYLATLAQLKHALAADTLDADALEAWLPNTTARENALRPLWTTGRIPHRRVAFTDALHHRPLLPQLVPEWVREAAQDPDSALRELALGSLSPPTPAQAGEVIHPQLVNADPELRLLALQTLRRAGHPGWTPVVLPFTSDPDPTVVLAADSLLRRWTGIDSGLRFSSLSPDRHPLVPVQLTAEQTERLGSAQSARLAWWRSQEAALAPAPAAPPILTPRRPLADWSLPDLDGRSRALSEFRGRVVLLNFWATWCPPCLQELPVLTQLQSELSSEFVVLGICLDTPPPPASSSAPTASPSDSAHSASRTTAFTDLARAVRVVAARHRINYPVLLDPDQQVGRRFDGQELPTQVLVDAEGQLVRRFLGPRSPAVWKALIQAAR